VGNACAEEAPDDFLTAEAQVLQGAVLYRAGEFDGAISALQRVDGRAGHDAWRLLFLAMAHQRLNQVDKARHLLAAAQRKQGSFHQREAFHWTTNLVLSQEDLNHLSREAHGLVGPQTAPR
jgi:hypothetical protein